LVYKDVGEQEKRSERFNMSLRSRDEPDAFYFIGYLKRNCKVMTPQLLVPVRARCFSISCSAEFGLARAYSAREMRKRRVNTAKISENHFTAPRYAVRRGLRRSGKIFTPRNISKNVV